MYVKNQNPEVTAAWQRFSRAKQMADHCTSEQATTAWGNYNQTYDAYVKTYNREVQAGWQPYSRQ